MEAKSNLIILVSAALILTGTPYAYTVHIHAPAVISDINSGVLTNITLNVTAGTGSVVVKGPPSVGNDTVASARTAALYASEYSGANESHYNFTYTILDKDSNVSGPSAGLAFTILAYAGLNHKTLYNNFTVTGTISSNGAVGEVGGVYDKLSAAKADGMRYAIVPSAFGSTDPEYSEYYITQQMLGIPVVQVSNFSQALAYVYLNDTGLARPFPFNATVDYHLGGLPDANVTCSSCNASYFGELVNYTFNFTSSWIGYLPENLSGARSNLLQNMQTYEQIAAKGYLYTGADLAFVQFPAAFVMANADNLTAQYAQAAITNVSEYCSALSSPALTRNNYEYVVGGRMRQEWASVQLASAQAELNSSNTTDGIIYTLSSLAPAYAWCNTASEMYGIASQMGGAPVAYSPQMQALASNAILAAKKAPSNPLYITAALYAYNKSEYGAALYSATYATSFGGQGSMPSSPSAIASVVEANARNSTFGIWPSQFANSAMFYLYQARASGGNDMANLTSAYTTSMLALSLDNANKEISGNLAPLPVNASALTLLLQNQTATLSTMSTEISELFALVFALVVIMAFMAIMLLVLLLRTAKDAASQPEKGSRRR